MKIVIQRVAKAKCLVLGKTTGEIGKGYLLLIGFTHNDSILEVKQLAKKISSLRVFEDEFGKMNLDLKQVSGSILAISQFTLYASCKHGNRPSFTDAMNSAMAKELYEAFCEEIKTNYAIVVEKGIFGADMQLDFINDGPVTIVMDSAELK